MEKDIQLTGIGNALIDLQYHISEEELNLLGYEKGTMHLINLHDQINIISKFSSRFENKMSGGSAANTIIAFAEFGGKAAYISQIGDDELGAHYHKEFEDLGIILSAFKDKESVTGTSFVMITPDGERTMATSLGANVNFHKDQIDEEIIARSHWLYLEGYKLTEKEGFKAIKKAVKFAKKHKTKIALTFSDKFIVELLRTELSEILEYSDLIFCNHLEGSTYTEETVPKKILKKLNKKVENIALTLGEKGSMVLFEDNIYEIPAYPSEIKDTTGAGDMYAAGLFYGLINHNDITFGGNLGSFAASKVISQLGARLQTNMKDIKDAVLNNNIRK